jgi:hypothetical protein
MPVKIIIRNDFNSLTTRKLSRVVRVIRRDCHLQQQDRFDHFVLEFNNERPQEGFAMACPASVYISSPRSLNRPAGYRLSLPRPRRPDHRLRQALHAPQEDQHLRGARRSACRPQGG